MPWDNLTNGRGEEKVKIIIKHERGEVRVRVWSEEGKHDVSLERLRIT